MQYKFIDKLEQGILPKPEELTSEELVYYKKISKVPINILEQDYAEEYIFHSPSNIQIKMHNISISESIDYTQNEFELLLSTITLKEGISWNVETPFVSFDYQNYRATLLHHCLFKEHGSKLFLRKLNQSPFEIQNFGMDKEIIQDLVSSKQNVLIAGSTGSGKTSFLNSMIQETAYDEHIIIAEDTFELISPNNQTTRFIAQDNPNKSLTAYMSYAMRMRPDRMVLGELRSLEVKSYLLALNSGHKGLFSTIHANSAEDAVKRVALLYKLYSEQEVSYSTLINLVAQNLDYVIYLNEKKVVEVIKVLGSNGTDIFYEALPFNEKESASCI
jgi:type IV secretion system protein VirB11